MPFARPTLTQLVNQTGADIATALPGSDSLLRFSNLGVLGRILAGMVNGLYGFLDWIARQSVPVTATDESLEAWAALKGVTRKPATQAIGEISFSGAGNATVAVSTPIVRSDGVPYIATGSASVSVGTVVVPAIAQNPGEAGNCQSGVGFVLGQAVAGVNSGGVADGAFTGGTDVESDAELRARMLEVYASPPQGGDPADYVIWALQVAGVTRAWTQPLAGGAGTVTVFFMMDDAESAFGGFPQGTNGVATNETRGGAPSPATGDQLAVANHIFPLRPVTALVTASAPSNNAVSFTINGISGASADTKAAISAAIADVFLTYGAPGGTVDANGAAIGGVDLSYIEAAIAAIDGTAGFVITAVTCAHGTITPGGDGNIASNTGYLPTLGTVTYT